MVRATAVFGAQPIIPLEIRLDSSLIVLYGESVEADDAELTGSVVLMHHESMMIKSVKVILEGARKLSWPSSEIPDKQFRNKQKFFCEQQVLFPSRDCRTKAQKVCGGNHEWPFKFVIPGDLPESVEGLPGSYIMYTVKAVVERARFLNKNLCASHHIRVVRTLGRDALESVPMEHINEDIWPNKLSYRVVLPRKNYALGTSITVKVELTPLRKGITLTSIAMQIHEKVQLNNTYGSHNYRLQLRPFQVDGCERIVARKEMDIPEDSQTGPVDSEATSLTDESFTFDMTLPLPQSLKTCRQSVETPWIQISHRLRTIVSLKNPEGHSSNVVIKNTLNLCIPPNIAVSDDQTLNINGSVSREAAFQNQGTQLPPPQYGEHQLDEVYGEPEAQDGAANIVSQLFTEIDSERAVSPFTGMSRNVSGTNTPFYNRSLAASGENLAAGQDGSDRAAVSQELYSRLDALHDGGPTERAMSLVFRQRPSQSEGSTPSAQAENAPPSNPSPANSYQPSNLGFSSQGASSIPLPQSRQNSVHDILAVRDEASGPTGDYDMQELSRTPSYKTAVRSPARTPISEGLPTYEAATSRSHSPAPQLVERLRLRNAQPPAPEPVDERTT